VVFETLTARTEGAVLVAEIAAPPMNLLGPELVRDLVSLIQGAEADDAIQVLVFTSADPDYNPRRATANSPRPRSPEPHRCLSHLLPVGQCRFRRVPFVVVVEGAAKSGSRRQATEMQWQRTSR
jgi:hypothetical protein